MKARSRSHGCRRGLGVAAMVVATLASAQERDGDDELAAKATDPTASLMSFQLYDWFTPSYRDVDGSTNQIVFRAAIPFSVAGTSHIFRVTQPYAIVCRASHREFCRHICVSRRDEIVSQLLRERS